MPALALAVFGAELGLSLPVSADVVLAVLPAAQAGAGNALNRALQRIAVCLAGRTSADLTRAPVTSRRAR